MHGAAASFRRYDSYQCSWRRISLQGTVVVDAVVVVSSSAAAGAAARPAAKSRFIDRQTGRGGSRAGSEVVAGDTTTL